MDLKELQKNIGYSFKNESLLVSALTHSSYANETGRSRISSNERLEFLGDSILGFVTAEYLYEKYPDRPEGEMTKIRAELVCEHSLETTAESLGLGEALLLGRGEERLGGRSRPSIRADAVEAVLAAIFLDGGMEPAKRFVIDHILRDDAMPGVHDFKTRLQELVQHDGEKTPSYTISGESGPDHAKVFSANVSFDGAIQGKGSGRTKKEAEQASAKDALDRLTQSIGGNK